jgi:hypothetical protein
MNYFFSKKYNKLIDNFVNDIYKEFNNKEFNNKEFNNKESDNKEFNNKEFNNKESDNKESDNKESDNKEFNNKESDNKESDNKIIYSNQKFFIGNLISIKKKYYNLFTIEELNNILDINIILIIIEENNKYYYNKKKLLLLKQLYDNNLFDGYISYKIIKSTHDILVIDNKYAKL